MRSTKTIHVVSAHAEGEVGDVIVGGVTPPLGETLWEQRNFLEQDQTLRNFMLNEPRGGVFRQVNLLVPPKDPNADAAFLIMEPECTPPMSGSNTICVATVLLDSGILPMQEPITELTLEVPAGLIKVRAECENGKAKRITLQNVPSFAQTLDVPLTLNGKTLAVDIAYGGDSFVIVDAKTCGFSIQPDEAKDIAHMGMQILEAAKQQLKFTHPENPNWSEFSFCLFAGSLEKNGQSFHTRHALTIKPGKIDRSPTGTAVSARMAVLHAKGVMEQGDTLIAKSIIDSQFTCNIKEITQVGPHTAIIPEVSGRAWITGTHQHMLDPDDPWPTGYRLSDTWGVGP